MNTLQMEQCLTEQNRIRKMGNNHKSKDYVV